MARKTIDVLIVIGFCLAVPIAGIALGLMYAIMGGVE